jgi:hypothetical protein
MTSSQSTYPTLMSFKRVRSVLAFIVSIFPCAVLHSQSAPMLMSPYLQAVTTNSIYVLVESSSTDTVSVEYGLESFYGSRAHTESYQTTTNSTYVHRIKLIGLSPNREYHYHALQAGATSSDETFHTAPNPGTSFHIAWMADCRSGTAVHDLISLHIASAKPTMSLYGGDLCIDSSYSAFKEQFFRPYELALVARVPFFNSPGNHEKWSQNTRAFTQAPESNSGTQEYYSFDYGDMHVLVLNNVISDDDASPQFRFAQSDLSSTKRVWNVVICHKPAYCAGGHGEDAHMKKMSELIFVPNHVDVVISGHSHFYQHNLVNGIHHMILGTAGALLYNLATAPYVVKSARDYNYGIIDVSPSTFKLMVYNERGMPLDTLLLNKSASKPGKLDKSEGLLIRQDENDLLRPSNTMHMEESVHAKWFFQ